MKTYTLDYMIGYIHANTCDYLSRTAYIDGPRGDTAFEKYVMAEFAEQKAKRELLGTMEVITE
jgi:hypothetical protein